MSADEARNMPWWEKKMLLEGLEVEFGDADGEGAEPPRQEVPLESLGVTVIGKPDGV